MSRHPAKSDDGNQVGYDAGQSQQKWKGQSVVAKKRSMIELINRSQIVSDQRWMIERDAVAISPLESVFIERFAKLIKADGVVRTESVKRDHELQHEAD